MFEKGNTVGFETRFGSNWSGQRCGAKTRSGNPCRRPAYRMKGRCALHGALATGPKTKEGRRRISQANLRHGGYTKEKLVEARASAELGKKIKYELDLIEDRLLRVGAIQPPWRY